MSPGPAGLRRAAPADLAAVQALQEAAYAANRTVLGVEPLPLLADYAAILRDDEVWLAHDREGLAGVLVLQPRPDDLLVWSVAIAPRCQGSGLGNALLAAAEARAAELGHAEIRLYTGQKLTRNVATYSRHGYRVESVETLPDRVVVHMVKSIGGT
jgi:ribosomal protein S18 acetylase RimI-like enzyme